MKSDECDAVFGLCDGSKVYPFPDLNKAFESIERKFLQGNEEIILSLSDKTLLMTESAN